MAVIDLTQDDDDDDDDIVEIDSEKSRQATERARRLAAIERRLGGHQQEIPLEQQQSLLNDSQPSKKRKHDDVNDTSVTNFSNYATVQPLPFHHGAVKRTWCKGYARRGDDIKLEELFTSPQDEISLVVLSSFIMDADFVLSKLPKPRGGKVQQVVFISQETSGSPETKYTGSLADGVRICYPKLKNASIQHSKLQLIFFNRSLRLVVPTANLVDWDWGEAGVMENLLYVHDFPLLNESAVKNDFSRELRMFLSAQGIFADVIARLDKVDWSTADGIRLVHSIAGYNSGNKSAKYTGYLSLAKAARSLQDESAQSFSSVNLDYIAASLGSINPQFVKTMFNSIRGRFPTDPATPLHKNDKLRILYPSRSTILASKGGAPAAGTICFSSKFWNNPKFPKSTVYDCLSTRDGCLMHTKTLIALDTTSEKGLMYIGSANLSESAWGKMTGLQKKEPALLVRNYECGVLLPIEKKSNSGKILFNNNIEIPEPARSPSDNCLVDQDKQPWMSASSF